MKAVWDFYKEANVNKVALIVIDYKMPGKNGIEVIKWIRKYLKGKRINPEDMPKFAFRGH